VTFYAEAAIPGDVLWGGALYLPTLFLMLVIGTVLYWRRLRGAAALLVAIVVFMLSFTARTLDAKLCTAFPIGTHFMWHLLNAVLLYILVRTAIAHSAPGAPHVQRR
jgi:hypothetical protein